MTEFYIDAVADILSEEMGFSQRKSLDHQDKNVIYSNEYNGLSLCSCKQVSLVHLNLQIA